MRCFLLCAQRGRASEESGLNRRREADGSMPVNVSEQAKVAHSAAQSLRPQ